MNKNGTQLRRKWNFLFGLLAALCITTLYGSSLANAATGTTSVTLNFPEVIVFHYVSELGLNFSNPSTDQSQTGHTGASANISLASATANIDAGLDTGQLSAGQTNNIDVNITNLWAVRGITPSGRIQIKSRIDTAQASNGGSSAKAKNLVVTSASGSGKEIEIATPGLGRFTTGGIAFSLDVSNVTRSGPHTGMRYTLEAVAAP